MFLLGGGVISFLNQMLCTMCFFSALGLLLYGVDLTIALMKFFVLRYQPMRQFTEQNIDDTGCLASIERVRSGMRRDAVERYLYIEHFIRESSKIWSPFILLSWFCCLLIIVISFAAVYTQYTHYAIIDIGSLLYFILAVIIALYLLFLIAQTNTTVELIKGAFTYSGLDDYSLLGGRTEWVAYIDQAPIYWTIMGFVITPAWVGAFVSSVAGLMASVFILPLFQ